jgi:hypothetical protein
MTTLLSFILVILFFYHFHIASAHITTTENTPTVQPFRGTAYALSPSPPSRSRATCHNGNDMVSLCPICHGSVFTGSDSIRRAVFCGTLWTKATYYEDEQASTVEECIDACMQFGTCDWPVIAPDGRCFVIVLRRDENEQLEGFPIQERGWAVLQPALAGVFTVPWSASPSVSATSKSPDSGIRTGFVQDDLKVCQLSAVSCPECNSAFVEDSLGSIYQVLCNGQWVHSSHTHVLDFDLPRCMVQCESTLGCLGLAISPAGCGLAIGDESNIQGSSPDTTAFLLSPSNAPTPFPSSSTGTAKSCQASSVSCPACANAYVKDNQGKIYHVLCDSSLYSERFYSVQHSVTPGGCMLACDNHAWCRGANFQSPGNCELARGEDVFPQRRSGSTAFLPVDLSYTPPPPQLSAFPTGEFHLLDGLRQTRRQSGHLPRNHLTRGRLH